MDNIFALHALTEIAKAQKKKLFCSFIDFSKAFDSVWRVGLWKKLLASNINGKCFQIILNMYKGIKSCVSYNLCDRSCNGVNFEFQYDNITLYLKLLVLLNADVTVVFLVQMRRNFKIV